MAEPGGQKETGTITTMAIAPVETAQAGYNPPSWRLSAFGPKTDCEVKLLRER